MYRIEWENSDDPWGPPATSRVGLIDDVMHEVYLLLKPGTGITHIEIFKED